MVKRRELERVVQSEDRIPGAMAWAADMIRRGLPAGPVAIRLGRERRTLDQNAKLWPMLTDISRQKRWVKDGQPCHLSPHEWKDLFTAALRKQSMAPGIEGGMVVLGLHTSRMTKRAFSDLIEFMYAQGSEWDIAWSEPAKQIGEDNRRKREREAA